MGAAAHALPWGGLSEGSREGSCWVGARGALNISPSAGLGVRGLLPRCGKRVTSFPPERPPAGGSSGGVSAGLVRDAGRCWAESVLGAWRPPRRDWSGGASPAWGRELRACGARGRRGRNPRIAELGEAGAPRPPLLLPPLSPRTSDNCILSGAIKTKLKPKSSRKPVFLASLYTHDVTRETRLLEKQGWPCGPAP